MCAVEYEAYGGATEHVTSGVYFTAAFVNTPLPRYLTSRSKRLSPDGRSASGSAFGFSLHAAL